MEEAKRRTKTSTAVKRRYNAKTYTRLAADLRNDDFARFEAARGMLSRAQFVMKLLEFYERNKPEE